LINPSRSKECEKTFAEIAFLSLETAYGQQFNFSRLRSELSVFYSNEDLSIQNASQLLLHLRNTNIDKVT
jgi:hypothetical protein